MPAASSALRRSHASLDPAVLEGAAELFDALEKVYVLGLEDEPGDPFQLSVANSIWGQRDYFFLDAFLDVLATRKVNRRAETRTALERIKVLEFRESRGWEVRHAFFTDQFRAARLTKDRNLDRDIDGISGATLSVRAMKKLAALALYLDGELRAQDVPASP